MNGYGQSSGRMQLTKKILVTSDYSACEQSRLFFEWMMTDFSSSIALRICKMIFAGTAWNTVWIAVSADPTL